MSIQMIYENDQYQKMSTIATKRNAIARIIRRNDNNRK